MLSGTQWVELSGSRGALWHPLVYALWHNGALWYLSDSALWHVALLSALWHSENTVPKKGNGMELSGSNGALWHPMVCALWHSGALWHLRIVLSGTSSS